MNAAELTKKLGEIEAKFEASIKELFEKLTAGDKRIAQLEASIKELSEKLTAGDGVVHGPATDGVMLNVLIDHYGAKEEEGVSVPVLNKLRKLRGDELDEDTGPETDDTAGNGGEGE